MNHKIVYTLYANPLCRAWHGQLERVIMKRCRTVQLYYRDEKKVMRKIEGLKVIIWRGEVDEVVYIPPECFSLDDHQKIILKNKSRKW